MKAAASLKEEFLRKLIHLSSLWMVAFIAFFDKQTCVVFFGVLLILFAIFEYVRMGDNMINRLLKLYFSGVMRSHEQTQKFDPRALTGSFYFILAVLLSVILFDKNIAMAGILVMILADTMAALVGKSMGRYKIRGVPKTYEGAAACYITAFAIIGMLTPLSLAATALIALVSTLVETYSHKFHINDNLSITLITAGLITLALGV